MKDKKKLFKKQYSNEEWNRLSYSEQSKILTYTWIRRIILLIIALFVLTTIICSITTVPTGFVGIKTRFGQVQDAVIQEGFNFKLPYIEKIVKLDCRTQKTEYTMEASSKDLKKISNFKLAVNYNITKDTSNDLYRKVGVDYKSIIVEPAIQEAMKATIANYTAEELITKRNEVSAFALEALFNKLQDSGITLTALNIIDLSFSPEFDKAVEEKQIVEQQTEKAKYELEKAKVENEKKIENAKAEAEVMKQQNAQITDQYLRLKEIENQKAMIDKWQGILPNTVLSEGGIFSILNKD